MLFSSALYSSFDSCKCDLDARPLAWTFTMFSFPSDRVYYRVFPW